METLNWVIVFVIGFLTINLINRSRNYFIQDKDDWHRQQAEDVLTWLLIMYPIRKKRPMIVINDSNSDLVGEYHYYTNVIIIYRRNNKRIRDVIQTTIHEFFHFYLITSEVKMDLYVRQLNEHGVHDHPQEVLCEAMEKVLVKRYLREFQ